MCIIVFKNIPYNTLQLEYTWNDHVGRLTCFIYSEYANWSLLCTECFTKKNFGQYLFWSNY